MWFWKKKPESVITSLPRLLFNHDLDAWNYLGHSEINYKQPRGKAIWGTARVHFFAHKDNPDVRSYHIVGDDVMKKHPFVDTVAEIWKSGQKHLSYPIVSLPSEFLIAYMKAVGYEWDKDNADKRWKKIKTTDDKSSGA